MTNIKKPTILIADDAEMNLEILGFILGEDYNIKEATDGDAVLDILNEQSDEILCLLLDLNMPKKNGFEVLEVMNESGLIESVPVIMITAEDAPEHMKHAFELGVTDFIRRPFDGYTVKNRVKNTVLLNAKRKKLEGLLFEQMLERHKSQNMLINILSHIVEFRNGESGMHVIHIKTLTHMLLSKLREITDKYPLTEEEETLIITASALHDIGKISVPDEVLNKPGRFTDEEFAIMKGHSAAGEEILKQVPYYQDEPLMLYSKQICRWHHERYDGRGYPDGIKGDDIPIAAQIVALADVYDALTSKRCYKDAYPHDKAIDMIKNGECGAFNPILLQCLDVISEGIVDELSKSTSTFDEKEVKKMIKELVKWHRNSLTY